jgi:hypothetical protein
MDPHPPRRRLPLARCPVTGHLVRAARLAGCEATSAAMTDGGKCGEKAVWAWNRGDGASFMLCDEHAADCDLDELDEL